MLDDTATVVVTCTATDSVAGSVTSSCIRRRTRNSVRTACWCVVHGHLWHTGSAPVNNNALPRGLFMANNCGAPSGRDHIIREMKKLQMVDSISGCENNKV